MARVGERVGRYSLGVEAGSRGTRAMRPHDDGIMTHSAQKGTEHARTSDPHVHMPRLFNASYIIPELVDVPRPCAGRERYQIVKKGFLDSQDMCDRA